MTIEWQRRGLSCSENRVARLLSKAGREARNKTAFRPKTTIQNPARLPAPNGLSKAPAPARPGEILVSDITLVATPQGWMSLAVKLALQSSGCRMAARAIIGTRAGDPGSTEGVLSRRRRSRHDLPLGARLPIHQCRDALLAQGPGDRSKDERGRPDPATTTPRVKRSSPPSSGGPFRPTVSSRQRPRPGVPALKPS